ncbi:MAG: amidohydrolase [Planctomycetota bacterium]
MPAASAAEVEVWLAKETPRLVQFYQTLHASPELSFKEKETAARMTAEARRMGFEVTEEVGGHGVVAVLGNGPGKTLLLRADMDALPVAEETGLEYASKVRVRDERGATVGVMHACGHDMHMTNLVGALRYLNQYRGQWSGTLVAMFQPAEERGAGAEAMLADGLLKRFPRPDYAVALHVAADAEAGTVGYRAGFAMANVDSVDITIRGRGGHGANPSATIDPVVIAAKLVVDLQTIVSREISAIEPAVVTVGSIHGGTKHNIIGDTCKLQLTVRSYTDEVRKLLADAIRRKANAAAASAGAPEPEVVYSEGTPALYNDPELVERLVPVIAAAVGQGRVFEVEQTMGGEDFGRIGRAGVPIAMLRLGTIEKSRLEKLTVGGAQPPSLHSPLYYPDAAPSIETGVKTLVAVALELLEPE